MIVTRAQRRKSLVHRSHWTRPPLPTDGRKNDLENTVR